LVPEQSIVHTLPVQPPLHVMGHTPPGGAVGTLQATPEVDEAVLLEDEDVVVVVVVEDETLVEEVVVVDDARPLDVVDEVVVVLGPPGPAEPPEPGAPPELLEAVTGPPPWPALEAVIAPDPPVPPLDVPWKPQSKATHPAPHANSAATARAAGRISRGAGVERSLAVRVVMSDLLLCGCRAT
jgi:hypothetical protein